jgi:hypothetical protein
LGNDTRVCPNVEKKEYPTNNMSIAITLGKKCMSATHHKDERQTAIQGVFLEIDISIKSCIF